jgi:hypothetical protein
MKKLSPLGLIVGTTLAVATPYSLHPSGDGSLSLSVNEAEARIGRPLTPVSVAGVNRRVHRRAYRSYYYHHGHRYYY